MRYLADTNLLIDYYRGSDSAKEYIGKLKSGQIEFCISVISEAEIWYGIKDDEELLYWRALLRNFEIVNVDSKTARKAGEIYKDYGHYMSRTDPDDKRFMADAFIAATCIILNETLLTANYKHFRQLVDRNLIKCEKYSP